MISLRAPPQPKPIARITGRRKKEHQQQRARTVRRAGAALLLAGCAGFALARLLGKRRRDKLRGHAVSVVKHRSHDYDDATLARKVESEIFRPADAPKGDVDVNAYDGTVELRGVVSAPEQIDALVEAAAHVDGVIRVENLLHLRGTPPRHAPPSDPAAVRARAVNGH